MHQIFLSFEQKNGPIAQLKNETENHERAKARIAVMRDEFNAEKYLAYKEQAAQQTAKAQELELRLAKIEEYTQEELARVQQNYAKIQKIVDDLQRKLQGRAESQSAGDQPVGEREGQAERTELPADSAEQRTTAVRRYQHKPGEGERRPEGRESDAEGGD